MDLTVEMLDPHGPVYGPGPGAAGPGVVIVHGGEGPMAGWSHRFAVILAAHGFRALPISYGEGDFFAAGPIRDVPLEGLSDAISALAAHTGTGEIGAFGWSRGAEKLALLASYLASTQPLAAVALHAGPDRVHSAFDPAAFRTGQGGLETDSAAPAAWTWRGQPVTPGADIAIEHFPGPVFLSVGDADDVWDPRMTFRLADRLATAGRPADLLVGKGQGHGYAFDREPELWVRLTAFFSKHLS